MDSWNYLKLVLFFPTMPVKARFIITCFVPSMKNKGKLKAITDWKSRTIFSAASDCNLVDDFV
jgi:hypothetical protein